MSAFTLRLRLFFKPKLLAAVVVAGTVGYLAVDDLIHSIAASIQFAGLWEPYEGTFQALVLDRGSRAVWLWTLLPAHLAWLYVGSIAKRIENLE